MAIEIKNKSGKVIHVVKGDTLVRADLWGADLQGADLAGAVIGSADFTGARNIDKAKGLKGVMAQDPMRADQFQIEPGASQLEQEWGPTLEKQAAGERLLAVNHYSTTWDDMVQDDFFTANLLLGAGGKLRLYITHRSKGLYTGDHTKVLEDLNVGTLQKPQLATIRSALAKHNGYKYNKFSKDWYRVDSAGKWTTRAPLSVILAEVAGELDASLDPKKIDGMRAAIMQKLDRMKPGQVEAVFNSIMKM